MPKLRDLKAGDCYRCKNHPDYPTVLVDAGGFRPKDMPLDGDWCWMPMDRTRPGYESHLDHEVEVLESYKTHQKPTTKILRLRDLPREEGVCFRYTGAKHSDDVVKDYGKGHESYPIVMLNRWPNSGELPNGWSWIDLRTDTTRGYFVQHADCPVELLEHLSTHPVATPRSFVPPPVVASCVDPLDKLLDAATGGIKNRELLASYMRAQRREMGNAPILSKDNDDSNGGVELNDEQKAAAKEAWAASLRAKVEESKRKDLMQVLCDIQELD